MADVAVITRAFSGDTPADVVRAALGSLGPGDYVAFLSYLPASGDVEQAIGGGTARDPAGRRARPPRSASARDTSTQPVSITRAGRTPLLAFVITADDETRTPIPESGYSFSILKRAQALGDFDTLEAHGRRVVRIHVKAGDHAAVVERVFAQALQ